MYGQLLRDVAAGETQGGHGEHQARGRGHEHWDDPPISQEPRQNRNSDARVQTGEFSENKSRYSPQKGFFFTPGRTLPSIVSCSYSFQGKIDSLPTPPPHLWNVAPSLREYPRICHYDRLQLRFKQMGSIS